ncbi:MAG TPA: hypothetical protein VGJ66_04880 [Pyrinomonadaceae bacterium]
MTDSNRHANITALMDVSERDKKMSDMASIAAGAFCEKYFSGTDSHIKGNPELYLQHTIPYLTVRALHRLEADSRWIKAFAIITGVLTAALVALTIVLATYAARLDTVIRSQPINESPTPSATPPVATAPP